MTAPPPYPVPRTLVSFHAHPDDEVLLTGGTLAKVAAAGDRVVLVVATSGEAGLAGPLDGLDGLNGERDLGQVREAELMASAAALGCARVVLLGYRDSGFRGEVDDPGTFTRSDPETAAQRLADILIEEGAGVLTIYDQSGGYGHPDHRQVHTVGVRAAELAGTPIVLEATIDRTLLRPIAWLTRAIRPLRGGLGDVTYEQLASAYSARRDITHRIDVRGQIGAKRLAMQAHASQATGDSARTLSVLLRLPGPLYRLVLGHEWFIQLGRSAPARVRDRSGDVFR